MHIRTAVDQLLYRFVKTALSGHHQGRGAIAAANIGIRACLEQGLNDRRVTRHREHQRRVAVLRNGIEVGTTFDQGNSGVKVFTPDHQMQRRVLVLFGRLLRKFLLDKDRHQRRTAQCGEVKQIAGLSVLGDARVVGAVRIGCWIPVGIFEAAVLPLAFRGGEVKKRHRRRGVSTGPRGGRNWAGEPWASSQLEARGVLIRGTAVAGIDELNAQLATYPPGSRVRLQLLRGLKRVEQEVELVPLSDEYLLAYTQRAFGFRFQLVRGALQVTSVEARSAAAQAGIEQGDRIVEIARRKIGDPDNFRRLMAGLVGREPLSFLVVRNNRGYLLQLPQD